MRKNIAACAALIAVVLSGCGNKEAAAPVSTTTTTKATTTTTTPKQAAAASYFAIVAENNPRIDALNAKYFPNGANSLKWSDAPAFCREAALGDQQFIDKLNAVSWPKEYQTQVNDLIAKTATVVQLEAQCGRAAGTAAAQAALAAQRSVAYDAESAAASALRGVLGLPVDRG